MTYECDAYQCSAAATVVMESPRYDDDGAFLYLTIGLFCASCSYKRLQVDTWSRLSKLENSK